MLSGTLRSTLDVFEEYEDKEIVRLVLACDIRSLTRYDQFDALRRVHLIPSDDALVEVSAIPESINVNVFRNLESSVSECKLSSLQRVQPC